MNSKWNYIYSYIFLLNLNILIHSFIHSWISRKKSFIWNECETVYREFKSHLIFIKILNQIECVFMFVCLSEFFNINILMNTHKNHLYKLEPSNVNASRYSHKSCSARQLEELHHNYCSKDALRLLWACQALWHLLTREIPHPLFLLFSFSPRILRLFRAMRKCSIVFDKFPEATAGI